VRVLTRYGADALVFVLLALAEIDAAFFNAEGPAAARYLLPLGWTLPLLARRRYPAFASLTVLGALALESRIAQPPTESLAPLPSAIWAFWIAGSIADRSRAISVGVAGTVFSGILIASNPGAVGVDEILFLAILALAPFLGGMAMRTREQHAADDAREREERARAAVIAERAQIGRELHDVVGHAISVMTVQAGAARMQLAASPERAEESLLAVEAAGRQALGEMRRMLEILRAGDGVLLDGPQPGLADLEGLLQQVRDSGVPVELVVEGEPAELGPGIDLAAYRIVQEALTNVIRHSRDARARVLVRYERGALELDVEDDGVAVDGVAAGGRGLVGMRERVSLYRGELEAGPRAEGGFAVRARLPVTADAP
jgi:signal transduction histidine kinase